MTLHFIIYSTHCMVLHWIVCIILHWILHSYNGQSNGLYLARQLSTTLQILICLSYLQYDKLWGLPHRVFTLLKLTKFAHRWLRCALKYFIWHLIYLFTCAWLCHARARGLFTARVYYWQTCSQGWIKNHLHGRTRAANSVYLGNRVASQNKSWSQKLKKKGKKRRKGE